VENNQYVNPFEDVYKKVQALKDRSRKIREKDTELRERNKQQVAAASEDTEKKTE